ncbi:DUF5067 domain-containing protein [Bifidobacterium myosotis]|uniref:DUF5067 domain-containing protein n=1 Tax=Bifidobacterium myosotis TaxID=1630166 RepID=A0A5M9ZH42_9BIFI|nr:DUF5067 domain-containing protein [Bifidobacterium myosotis]KAA8826937.1 DUF5067 domain-containing protein [Bifidobacterium myosotis]
MNGKARTAIGIGVALLAAAAIAFGVWWQSGRADAGAPPERPQVSTEGDIKAGHVRIGSVTRTDDIIVVRVEWTNRTGKAASADSTLTVRAWRDADGKALDRTTTTPARSGFDAASVGTRIADGKTATITYAFDAPKDDKDMVAVTVTTTFATDESIVSKTVRPTPVA